MQPFSLTFYCLFELVQFGNDQIECEFTTMIDLHWYFWSSVRQNRLCLENPSPVPPNKGHFTYSSKTFFTKIFQNLMFFQNTVRCIFLIVQIQKMKLAIHYICINHCMILVKGTLHFNINYGSKCSLDPP